MNAIILCCWFFVSFFLFFMKERASRAMLPAAANEVDELQCALRIEWSPSTIHCR